MDLWKKNYAIRIDFDTNIEKEKKFPKNLHKYFDNSYFFMYKEKYFTQYIIERKQKSLEWMCEQDKAFYEAYNK